MVRNASSGSYQTTVAHSSFAVFILANQVVTSLTFQIRFDSLDQNSTVKENISILLDGLLEGYDHHVRPNFGGQPTKVFIDIEVRSMGPVSEIDMSFSMDCYFRQSWADSRLEFSGAMSTLALSITMLEKIWRPDTYFYNGKHSYLHTITSPNKFVRIHQNGRVLYSSRLTIRASCPMDLRKFPMDIQRCPLYIGSFGYSSDDVTYHWNAGRGVMIAPDMKMSQFDLIFSPASNLTKYLGKEGPFSVLAVIFHLQRHMTYFLIEVYAPCSMLVVLSWVSFWINREATADRVALGITTLLTMTFLGLESRNDLPKVSYCTALDCYVAISFVFIFSVIVEFAAVHLFTKVGSGEFYFPQMSSSEDSCSEEWDTEINSEEVVPKDEETTPFIDKNSGGQSNQLQRKEEEKRMRVSNSYSQENHNSIQTKEIRNSNMTLHPLVFSHKRPSVSYKRKKKTRKTHSLDMRLNSVSRIDKSARILFPFTYLLMNFIYWYTYLEADR